MLNLDVLELAAVISFTSNPYKLCIKDYYDALLCLSLLFMVDYLCFKTTSLFSERVSLIISNIGLFSIKIFCTIVFSEFCF